MDIENKGLVIRPGQNRLPHFSLSREQGFANQPKDMDWLATNIPCQDACPAHTRIPDYLGEITRGNYDEAYRINLVDNVFPGVLGRVSYAFVGVSGETNTLSVFVPAVAATVTYH